MTSTYVYLILAWSPRNWMDILSQSASVRFVSLPCKMERESLFIQCREFPMYVHKTASASVTQTSVYDHSCPVAAVSGQEPPVRRIWPFSKVIPQTLCCYTSILSWGPCFTLRWGKKYTNQEDLASPLVNLWACLHAYSCLPLCGVSTNTSITFTCSLVQFFLHTWGLYSLRFTLSSASFVSSLCFSVIGLKTSTGIVQL